MALTQSLTKLKKILYLSVFIALAIVLNLIDLPLSSFIPGSKLGLANLSTVLSLVMFGPSESVLVAFFRTILGAIVKGTLHPIPFFTSFLGATGAALVMAAAYRPSSKIFSITGISVIGGITNNVLQFFVVLYITRNRAFWYYFPILVLLGSITGGVIGIIAQLIYNRIRNVKWKKEE